MKHLLLGKNKLNCFEAYNLNVVKQISKLERVIFTIELRSNIYSKSFNFVLFLSF